MDIEPGSSLLSRFVAPALLALGSAHAAASPLHTIDVLCAGTAPEDRAYLAAEVHGATMALEFYVDGQRERIGQRLPVDDVDVLFVPAQPALEAFGITTDGPVCLLALPPGTYRLEAWYRGQTRTLTTTIPPARGAVLGVAVGFDED